MSDSIEKGIKAGLLGTLGDILIHYSSYFIFKTTTTEHYISQLIFPLKNVNPLRFSISALVHFSAGALVGILLPIIFKYFGKDHPYYKGIGLGISLWIIHVVVIPNLINSPRPIIFRTELETIVDLLAHIIYGILATIYVIKNFNQEILK